LSDDQWALFVLLVLVVDVIVILTAAWKLAHGSMPDLIGPYL
jgi:hypothetical protein